MKSLRILSLILIGIFFLPRIALADDGSTPPSLLDVATRIPNIINIIIAVSVSVFFIILVVAGYQFITALGDKEKIQSAQKSIFFSVIGFALIFGSFLILQIILKLTQLQSGVSIDPSNGSIFPTLQSNYVPTTIPPDLVKKSDNLPTQLPGGDGYCGGVVTIGSEDSFITESNCAGFVNNLTDGVASNADAVGDKSNFVSTVKSKSKNLGNEYDDDLGEIWDVAHTYDVNPAILASIWRVESGFSRDSVFLDCGKSDFSSSLRCAAQSIHNEMTNGGAVKGFKQALITSGSNAGWAPISKLDSNKNPTGGTCYFSTAFTYAYDWYTPVCHAYDNNLPPDHPSRASFIDEYDRVMGLK